jgi:hypothetical protein
MLHFIPLKKKNLLGAGGHACNPSYSGGRDQEDHGSKPARGNSSETLSQKARHKKWLVEWLKGLSACPASTRS